jgi:hypothetical protein
VSASTREIHGTRCRWRIDVRVTASAADSIVSLSTLSFKNAGRPLCPLLSSPPPLLTCPSPSLSSQKLLHPDENESCEVPFHAHNDPNRRGSGDIGQLWDLGKALSSEPLPTLPARLADSCGEGQVVGQELKNVRLAKVSQTSRLARRRHNSKVQTKYSPPNASELKQNHL